jgi:hypothetical protein
MTISITAGLPNNLKDMRLLLKKMGKKGEDRLITPSME